MIGNRYGKLGYSVSRMNADAGASVVVTTAQGADIGMVASALPITSMPYESDVIPSVADAIGAAARSFDVDKENVARPTVSVLTIPDGKMMF